MRQDLRIIVEGMDGAGKTTLIEKLVEHIPNLVVVRNTLDDKQNFEKWWPQEVDREKSGLVPVHDRFFFSEIVYGPVLRGKINAPQTLVDNIAWFLRTTAFLIYVRPHSDLVRKGVNELDHMVGVKENFDALLDLYDNVMAVEKSWFHERFFHYDWNNYSDLILKLREYLAGELYGNDPR